MNGFREVCAKCAWKLKTKYRFGSSQYFRLSIGMICHTES
jgi:hypothetical protein